MDDVVEPPAKRFKLENSNSELEQSKEVKPDADFTQDIEIGEKFAVEDKYNNFVHPEELEKLREFQVLDEVKSNDEDSNDEESDSSDGKSEVPEEEIEKMLEEDLPEDFKGAPKPKVKPYITRQKVVLEEKGVNHFEVLPLDWMMVRHYSGMPVYMHRATRVCTLSKPYFLGKGNTRRHDIPISAIPCLAYRKALEEEEKQKEIDRHIEEQIKNGTWQQNLDSNKTDSQNNTGDKTDVNSKVKKSSATIEARCPFLHGKAGKENKEIPKNHDMLISQTINSEFNVRNDIALNSNYCDVTESANDELSESKDCDSLINSLTKSLDEETKRISEINAANSEENDVKVNVDIVPYGNLRIKSSSVEKSQINDAINKTDNSVEAKIYENEAITSQEDTDQINDNMETEVNNIQNESNTNEHRLSNKVRTDIETNENVKVLLVESEGARVNIALNAVENIRVGSPQTEVENTVANIPPNEADRTRSDVSHKETESTTSHIPLIDANATADTSLNGTESTSSDVPLKDANAREETSLNEAGSSIADIPLNDADANTEPSPCEPSALSSIPLSRRAVVLPDGAVMPPPRVETVSTSWKTQHLNHEQINDYCKKLFKFKTVNIMHFKCWADRRKYNKARKTLQYPTLPEGTKLITIPASTQPAGEGDSGGKANKRDWVMNMNGRSYLSVFHEYVRRALQKQPVYEFKQLENASTPYQATVFIGGIQYGVGHGSSKRSAKSAAARASIHILIPEMRAELDQQQPENNNPNEPDFSFFDYVGIEDPRITEFCAATCEPSPHAILRTCLLRNFGAGDKHIHTEMKKLEYQKIELTMKVGKHTATVVCKNKKTAKQRASQAILQALHPHVRSWGSLLRLYGSRSVKSCKEKKLEEQQITLLQDAARHNQPNHAVLDKLRHEMRKLRARDAAVVPIGTLLLHHELPTHSGSNLNNVDL